MLHEGSSGNPGQTFSFVPQAGDAITVDFYWED